MLRIATTVCILLLSVATHAECDFKTGQYISELQQPSNIKLIEIETPKSSKFSKNLIKIATSKSRNIPPKLKKYFDAKIVVHYKFGKCVFRGKIRQNGDWKDHINIIGNKLIGSLNIKLNSGNILSAVRFKLLLPDTRNSKNEILVSLVFKHIGIISPETFAILTKINGVSSVMLFQENARKELLEKNFRRESALFEGDEELIWSYEKYSNFELRNLALSRMINKNWFQKGRSSQKISLSAFSKLQSSYMDYRNMARVAIYPNNNETPTFFEYRFVMFAINGTHGLAPHNRKYYFNPITSYFEPIYYDGNASFYKLGPLKDKKYLNKFLTGQLKTGVRTIFIERIKRLKKSDELKIGFIKRTEPLGINASKFYDNAISRIISNVDILHTKIAEIIDTKTKNDSFTKDGYLEYFKRQDSIGLAQQIITKLHYSQLDGYKASFRSGKQKQLSIKKLSKVLSDNTLDGKRTILLTQDADLTVDEIIVMNKTNLQFEITATKGISIDISDLDKTISFKQSKLNDWVLIKSGALKDWNIKFEGVRHKATEKLKTEQRFNKYGLTGCLTFYDTNFENTSIETKGGACEDSLNIISSTGTLKLISIYNSFADAIDIDFSTVEISKVEIENAGNDCLDVSGGKYKVKSLVLRNCYDKGVSVGEKSTFNAQNIDLVNASIGISSKDLSKVEISELSIKNTPVCAEVKQKKQEFGGAFLSLKQFDCIGKIEVDENSIFEKSVL